MPANQPTITSAGAVPRHFAASAAAVQAVVVNADEQILLLSNPRRGQGWQLVSGALEAGETILDGALRELHEELGSRIRVRPLGTVHIETFHYDERVQYVISINYLFAYLGGDIEPGDDMAGSAFRWWSMAELEDRPLPFHATVKPWMLARAVELYRLWRDQPDHPLQPALEME
jgi:ADP-ribose pyrophosphatase YjhB (NUDIX family)